MASEEKHYLDEEGLSRLVSDLNEGFSNKFIDTEEIEEYATKEFVRQACSSYIKIKIVDELPTEDISTTTIYLVPKSEGAETTPETNVYDEYVYVLDEESTPVTGHWEKIGSTEVDLSDYLTKYNVDDVTIKVNDEGNLEVIDPCVQSDYGQNDSDAKDYIKNRTHYESQETCASVDVSGSTTIYFDFDIPLVTGKTYTIEINGETDEFTAGEDSTYGVGSGSIYNTAGGKPCVGACWYSSTSQYDGHNGLLGLTESGVTSTAIIINSEIHQLDDKYISDNIARVSDVNKKVDKEDGKGLSTNDFTDELKTKLEGIEEGAEVNVQSDWNENDEVQDAFIKNRTHYYIGESTYCSGTPIDGSVNFNWITPPVIGNEYVLTVYVSGEEYDYEVIAEDYNSEIALIPNVSSVESVRYSASKAYEGYDGKFHGDSTVESFTVTYKDYKKLDNSYINYDKTTIVENTNGNLSVNTNNIATKNDLTSYALASNVNDHINNSSIHVTLDDKSNWDNKIDKISDATADNIPLITSDGELSQSEYTKTDLANAHVLSQGTDGTFLKTSSTGIEWETITVSEYTEDEIQELWDSSDSTNDDTPTTVSFGLGISH